MKIALLSDTHANLPALRAVIAHARRQNVDAFWHLGDSVGYSPFPRETIAFLRQVCDKQIVGNYDLKVLSPVFIRKLKRLKKDPDKVFSFVWTRRALSDEDRAFLSGLPRVLRVRIDGKRILMTHGSPRGIEDPLTPWSAIFRLREIAREAKADLVLCGHTHRAFERRVGRTLFVNPGGVGRSFDGDPRASYAVLDIRKKKISVEPFRVRYDAKPLVREMRDRGFPSRLIDSLTRARSLDDLQTTPDARRKGTLHAARRLAHRCPGSQGHFEQVRRLALSLFDGLYPGDTFARERFWLEMAAILHDVGMAQGVAGHHKASRDIILGARGLPVSDEERRIIALVARYHRRGLPRTGHAYYRDLSFVQQEIVAALAAILRVADGLDRTHRSAVREVHVHRKMEDWTLDVWVRGEGVEEQKAALRKGDLWGQVWGNLAVRLRSGK